MKLLNILLFYCIVFYGQQLNDSSVYVEPDVYGECKNIDVSRIDYCLQQVAKKLDDLDSKKPKPKEQIKLLKELKKNLENKKKVLNQKQEQKNKRKEKEAKERIRENQTLALANPSGTCHSLWVNPIFSPKRGGLTTGFVTKSYVTFTNNSDLSVDIRSGTGEDVVLSLCPKTTITIGVNNSYSDYSYEYTMIAVDTKGKTSVFRFYSGYRIDDRRTYFFDIN